MTTTDRIAHSGGVPSTPSMRLLIVRDYATTVFGDEQAAESWLGHAEPSVLDGQCVVATACLTREGFDDAMRTLGRLRRERLEAADSPHSPGNPQPGRPAPPRAKVAGSR